MRLKTTRAKLRKTAVAVLFVLAVIIAVYTAGAYYAAGSITEVDGQLMWSSAPRGSLFPLPNVAGNLMTTISVLETDAFIYTYLIRTGVLAAVTVLLWAASVWSIWKTRRRKGKARR
jgi:hypothetical protein